METVKHLVRKHSGELFAYLCRFVGNHAAAEDILSDVFVKLMQNKSRFEDENFNSRAWLYKVATNCAISHLRKQKIRSFLSIEKIGLPDESSGGEKLLERQQEGQKVKEAIGKLSKKLKSALILQIYHEFSYKEIADALKISIGTVKSRLNEAKEKIREMMEE